MQENNYVKNQPTVSLSDTIIILFVKKVRTKTQINKYKIGYSNFKNM